MKEAAKVFSKVVLSDKKVKIKLLGDSITHGVGGTGFAQSGEPIVAGFARNSDGFCWAKLFKDYMEKQYNCEVVNNACTGRDIQFISHYFDQLVDKDDDIVICTIGTNNRQQYFRTGERIPKTEYMMEHPLTETAEHFFLSESRAKSTEKLALDNVWLELPWWFH